MAKKLILDPILANLTQIRAPFFFFFFFPWILPLLHVRHCRQLSLYVTSKKTNEPNLRKLQKIKVLGPHLAHLAYQALDIMVSDHHVQHQKKLMIQS